MSARKSPKGTVHFGTVQSLVAVGGGEWIAVVSAFTSRPGEPIISMLTPVVELKGSARRKADRWLAALRKK